MTKDELIGKQQIEIEDYKEVMASNEKLKAKLCGMFYGIGAPMNDNLLKFNKEQIVWCSDVFELIGHINFLDPDEIDD